MMSDADHSVRRPPRTPHLVRRHEPDLGHPHGAGLAVCIPDPDRAANIHLTVGGCPPVPAIGMLSPCRGGAASRGSIVVCTIPAGSM